jgi:hypothetical protein
MSMKSLLFIQDSELSVVPVRMNLLVVGRELFILWLSIVHEKMLVALVPRVRLIIFIKFEVYIDLHMYYN